MKSKATLAALLGAFLVIGTSSARAVTMDTLLAGGSISCDYKLFDKWRDYNSAGFNGASGVLSSEIDVECNVLGPGSIALVYSSAKWKADAGQSQDTRFKYDVHVLPGGA